MQQAPHRGGIGLSKMSCHFDFAAKATKEAAAKKNPTAEKEEQAKQKAAAAEKLHALDGASTELSVQKKATDVLLQQPSLPHEAHERVTANKASERVAAQKEEATPTTMAAETANTRKNVAAYKKGVAHVNAANEDKDNTNVAQMATGVVRGKGGAAVDPAKNVAVKGTAAKRTSGTFYIWLSILIFITIICGVALLQYTPLSRFRQRKSPRH